MKKSVPGDDWPPMAPRPRPGHRHYLVSIAMPFLGLAVAIGYVGLAGGVDFGDHISKEEHVRLTHAFLAPGDRRGDWPVRGWQVDRREGDARMPRGPRPAPQHPADVAMAAECGRIPDRAGRNQVASTSDNDHYVILCSIVLFILKILADFPV